MTEGASTLMDMRLLAAQAVAREAGALARRRFLDQSFTVGFKGPQDYLTEVDGETEALIAQRLLQIFPSRRVHRRREQGPPRRRGRRDLGRRSDRRHGEFCSRVPHFCVSIACVAAGKVEVGVIYDPIRDELFAGRRGGGARLNGASMRASNATALASSAIEVGWNMRASADQYVDLLRRVADTRALRPSARALARLPSPMSRPAGLTVMSSITSMRGIASQASCWSARRAGT